MSTRTGRLWALLAGLGVCGFASGCATVKPWDRDLLARKEMQFVADPIVSGIDQHVYFSKEASTGGVGAAGGGCGCN